MAETDAPAARGSQVSERLLGQVAYLYNAYGDAYLNRLYYGRRLARVKRWNTALEIAIAIGTSSAVGAWALWKEGQGAAAWAVLAGISTVLSILKPILQLPKEIERYSRLTSGHNTAFEDLKPLVQEVRAARRYPKQVDLRLREIEERVKQLAELDDPTFSDKLVDEVYRKTLTDIPKSKLWWPQAKSTEAIHEEKSRQAHRAEEESGADAAQRRHAV